MMKVQTIHSVDAIVPVPPVTISIRTGNKQTVQNSQKNSPLNIKLELSVDQMVSEDLPDTQLFP
jgi:hypothetical protein